MGVKCNFVFNSSCGVFLAGQTLDGVILLLLDNPDNVRHIYFVIKGVAQCEWDERLPSNSNRKTNVAIFQGQEEYLSSLNYLVGNDNTHTSDLPKGTYTYKITCTLPTMLPSSFQGTYGSIRYMIEVVIIRPKKADEVFTHELKVLRPFNLNSDPLLRLPVEETELFDKCPCVSLKSQLTVKLQQSGYVPEQDISIVANFNSNKLYPQNKLFKFILTKIIIYTSSTPSRRVREVMEELVNEFVYVPYNVNNMLSHSLKIPQTQPTTLNECNIIKISYELKVVDVRGSGCNSDLHVEIPIIIGTVPIVPSEIHPVPTIQMMDANRKNKITANVVEMLFTPIKRPNKNSTLVPNSSSSATSMITSSFYERSNRHRPKELEKLLNE